MNITKIAFGRFLIIIFFNVFGCTCYVTGQTIRDINSSIQSPTVANLGLFKEMPVSLFTGLPSVEIPLLMAEQGDLSVPVKLSYHASGFRPDIKPGIIAPNWALSAGGVIQRKVKDRPDDLNLTKNEGGLDLHEFENFNFNSSGFYFNRSRINYLLTNNNRLWGQKPFLDDLSYPGDLVTYYSSAYMIGLRDSESDEYSFTIPGGGGGNFYFDLDGKLVVQSNEHFLVKLLQSPFLDVPFTLPVTTKQKNGNFFTYGNGHIGNNWRTLEGRSKTFSGFIVIDSKGIEYTFGSNADYIEYSIDFVNQDRDFWQADAWHLKRIEHPNGDIINFTYERKGFSDQLSQYVYWNIDTKYNNNTSIVNNFLGAIACTGVSNSMIYTYTGRLTAPLYLNEISTNSKRVKFNYTNSNYYSRYGRTYNNPAIPTIATNPYERIHNYYFASVSPTPVRENEPNETINFPYYFNSLPYPYLIEYYNANSVGSSNQPIAGQNYNASTFALFYADYLFDYRLNNIEIFNNLNNDIDEPIDLNLTIPVDVSLQQKIELDYAASTVSDNRYNLSGVSFKIPSGEKISSYALDYFPFEDGICKYFDLRTDHWGFYTGNAMDMVLTNDIKDNHSKYYNARNPSLKYAKMNMLKSITYPTGGKTDIEYELNDAYFSVDKNRTTLNLWNKEVGGLRVKKLTHQPLFGSNQTKRFFYKKNYRTTGSQVSSGVLAYEPKYLHQNFKTKTYQNVIIEKTIFSMNSFTPSASSSQGSHIGYSEVVAENSDGSYTKHFFTNFDNGYLDVSEMSFMQDLSPFHPFSSKELERGKEIKTEMYDNVNRLIKKVETEFTNLNPTTNNAAAVYIERNKLCTGGWYEFSAKYYTNYTYAVLPTKVTTTDYIYGGTGAETMVDVKEMTYNNQKQIKDVTNINSKKEVLKTEYKYSTDFHSTTAYTNDYGIAVNELAKKNIIVPVEVVLLKNGTIIQADLFEYKMFSNLNSAPQLFKTSKWNKAMSASYAKLHVNGTSLVSQSNLQEEARVDSYNKMGKPTQIALKGNDITSYVWGFYRNYPLAVVKDVSYESIKSNFSSIITTNETYLISSADLDAFELNLRNHFTNNHIYFYKYNQIGLMSKMSPPNEVNTFFVFDEAFRLKNVLDKTNSILKQYEYFNLTKDFKNVFANDKQIINFYKNGCSVGFYGSRVSFEIPEGTVISTISKDDANIQARMLYNQEGQNFANMNGICYPEGTHISLCSSDYRQIVNGNYLETYLTYEIKVYKDEYRSLLKTSPVNIEYRYNGINTLINVTGTFSLGERLLTKEYIGPLLPGEEGVYLESLVEIINSPAISSILYGECGPVRDIDDDVPVLPNDLVHGQNHAMVSFTSLSSLCAYNAEQDEDIVNVYYYNDPLSIIKCFTDDTKTVMVPDGYYTFFQATNNTGKNVWFKIEFGDVTERGVCP